MQPRPTDVDAVRRALEQARRAGAAGEVPIGAVVIGPDGDVLGVGANEREATHDPTAHAEVVALRAAASSLGTWRLDGCVLAVTLEPCPMCAGAAWLSRVDRVVFGAWNTEYGAAGSLWDVLRDGRLNHRPEVVAGVLADECSAVLADFFAARRTAAD
ncbi:tRNA adenosine(34) deaminase TadA [Longivirga aurantiaca]|uniref:tRNA-specific adenosine deaminase n=1 Tax=Longivirga aurantiaca TaxID=1837743 RepID=A0ABW1T6K7_9ACTN